MNNLLVLLVMSAVLFAGTATGQGVAGVQGGTISRAGGMASFSGPPSFAPPAIVGAPYSADETSERVQTLMDGTHITQKMPGRRVYRDSQGRTRTERPLFMRPNLGPEATDTRVVIDDPVAGFRYTLDTQSRVVHRITLPPAGSRPSSTGRVVSPAGETVAAGAVVQGFISGGDGSTASPSTAAGQASALHPPIAAAQAGALQPQVSSESLGTQVINGVMADGTRRTVTFPVGMQGNDRPIVTTSETWTSPDLKIVVLSKTMDPRSGENTMQLTNLSRTEPDPSLFAVPPDYSVVDETAPFSIRYSVP